MLVFIFINITGVINAKRKTKTLIINKSTQFIQLRIIPVLQAVIHHQLLQYPVHLRVNFVQKLLSEILDHFFVGEKVEIIGVQIDVDEDLFEEIQSFKHVLSVDVGVF